MTAVERADATVREQWDTDARTYTMWTHGAQTLVRPFTALERDWADAHAAELAARASAAAQRARMRENLDDNRAYLAAVAAGTVALPQALAQVAALTRQIEALMIHIIDLP